MAEQIGVTKCTIQYWETNRLIPALRFLPRIVEFLGYDPGADGQPSSLADQLKAHRRKLGLSRKKLANLLHTDESNLAGWETGRHQPVKRSLELICEFLSWTPVRQR